jgi:cell division septation protein DedD
MAEGAIFCALFLVVFCGGIDYGRENSVNQGAMMNARKLQAAMAFLLVLVLGASVQAGLSEDDVYLSAIQQFNQHDWENARKSLQDFQTHFPDSRWRWGVKLRLADLEPDPEIAEKLYREVIVQKDNAEWGWDARWGLAAALYARGHYPEARAWFLELAQSRDVRRVRAQYYAGLSALALNQTDAARDAFSEILEHHRQAEVAGPAMISLGDAEIAAHHPDAARRLYNQYLQDKPEGELAGQAQERLRALEGAGNTPTALANFPKPVTLPTQPSPPVSAAGALPVAPRAKAKAAAPSKPLKDLVAAKVAIPAPTAVAEKVPVPGTRVFCVQVGAFSKLEYAQNMVRKMQSLGLTAFLQDTTALKEPLHMVRIGPFATRAEAEHQAEQLHQNEGMPALVVAGTAPAAGEKPAAPTTPRNKP